jgi:hypothetical protein
MPNYAPFYLGPLRNKQYATEFQLYFNDNFSLRSLLLSIHGQIEYSLFGLAREVIIGRDGWLTDKKILEEHLPQLDQIDDQQIQAGILQIKRLQHWLASRHIKFYVVIIPVKPTIYSEKFPDKYKRKAFHLGIDKFQSALKNNDIPFIDLYKIFEKEAKKNQNLYYKTDMHWNTYGISVAAKSIIDRLSSDYYFHNSVWSEEYSSTKSEFKGGELNSIPLLWTNPEIVENFQSLKPSYLEVPYSDIDGKFFLGTDQKKAIFPPMIMFGNSFMQIYQETGFYNYFRESARFLDYSQFRNVLNFIKPKHKIFILQIYENQLQYHIMPTGKNNAWSGFDQYWDPRIKNLSLPSDFIYKNPD